VEEIFGVVVVFVLSTARCCGGALLRTVASRHVISDVEPQHYCSHAAVSTHGLHLLKPPGRALRLIMLIVSSASGCTSHAQSAAPTASTSDARSPGGAPEYPAQPPPGRRSVRAVRRYRLRRTPHPGAPRQYRDCAGCARPTRSRIRTHERRWKQSPGDVTHVSASH
jgi:hypothetical protein